MNTDDPPRKQPDTVTALGREDIDPLSVEEHEERVAALKAEIARCEGKIAFARSHRSSADALFKKP